MDASRIDIDLLNSRLAISPGRRKHVYVLREHLLEF